MGRRLVVVGPSERLTDHVVNRADVPQGAMYPDGLPVGFVNPDVQKSVRPEGTVFVQSPGYETVRVGRSQFQHEHGIGIGFVPLDLAEDPRNPSVPLVAPDEVGTHAETARVDTPVEHQEPSIHPVVQGRGDAPVVGDEMHRVYNTPPDMGDREAHRPSSAAWAAKFRYGVMHPEAAFREEWRENPVAAVLGAAAVVAVAYMIGHDLERAYVGQRRRSGGGPAASVAAAPSAAVETAGAEARKATDAAAGAVKEAGQAVEDATHAVADAVTD